MADEPKSLFEEQVVPDISFEEFLAAKLIDWSNIVGYQKPADGATKNQIFAQNAAPTGGYKEGDLWFDTDDNNKIYRANSALSWVSVKDGTIATAATTANWSGVVDDNGYKPDNDATKNIITRSASTSAPSTPGTGDLWYQTDTYLLKKYNGASWDNVGNAYDNTNQLTDGAVLGQTALWASITGTGKPADSATVNAIFAQTSIPTSLAVGDLWVDTDDGNKLYRAASVGATTIAAGQWVLVTDTVVDDGVAPAAPTGLTASAGIQAVFLKWTWNTETDMDHYDVYRYTADTQASAVKIASVKLNMMFDSGLTAATPYYYWLKAIDRKGNVSGFNASVGTTATPRNVGTTDVQNLAIDSAQIAASAITTAKIAADAVTAAEIATGAVGSTELAASSVIAGKIAALTIVAADIAAGTITGAKIAATTVAAANIVAGTITSNELASNSVIAGKIAANAVTATEINVANLAAIKADLGAITAGTITLPNTGYIRGGQTDYQTGTGFFLGYSGAAYKFSVGNPAGKYIAWDGSDFAVNGFVLSSKGIFGGDGSGGDLDVTATTTLNDAPTDGIKVYNYNNLTIGASGVLTTGANLTNCIVILKIKGNLTITNGGKIDLKGRGGAGGGGAYLNGAASAGGGGTAGLFFLDILTHIGGGGGGINGYSAGGGGGGSINSGTAGQSGGGGVTVGSAGVAITNQFLYMNQGFKTFYVCPGSGGGGGGFGAADAGGAQGGGNGGNGGGAIIIEVNGNISVGASAWIDITGTNGQDGQYAGAYSSGGGGGAGGMALVLYNGTLTGAGTVTTTATTGGAKSSPGTYAGAGGTGSAGTYRIQQNLMFV